MSDSAKHPLISPLLVERGYENTILIFHSIPIGLEKHPSPSTAGWSQWPSGSNVTFTNWCPNEPSEPEKQSVVTTMMYPIKELCWNGGTNGIGGTICEKEAGSIET